jgi:hypothetical protein
LGDVDHAVVDTELGGECGDPVGDLRRKRSKHQRAQQHHLDPSGPEGDGAALQEVREVRRCRRFDIPEVDAMAGHRRVERFQQHPLELGQSTWRCDGERDAAGRPLGLDAVGRIQEHDVVRRRRHGHGRGPQVPRDESVTRRDERPRRSG